MICKICDHETILVYDKQFDINYYRCEHCEFLFMDSEAIVSFEEERAIYDTHENSIENQGYVDMFKNFLDKCVLPFKQTGSLLDFGSGPEPVLIQVINRDYNFETQHYDLHYAPDKVYEGQMYDVIVSTEVVEHISDPLPVFELLTSHLKPNGIFAFMTLYHLNDDLHFSDWWYRRDETHISFFTLKTLEVIAAKCGCEVIYTDNKRLTTFRKLA